MTLFWGVFSIAFAMYANRLGSLIEAVNKVGSIFYGTMLAVFLIAFYLPHVKGTAAFSAALIALGAVLYCAANTSMAWLWWNVVGCVVGVVSALVIQWFLGFGARGRNPATP